MFATKDLTEARKVSKLKTRVSRPSQASTPSVNGVTVTNSYDELHRLTRRVYPDGGAEGFIYSAEA